MKHGLGGVALRGLDVNATGRGGPLMPARLGLRYVPPFRLLHLMAGPAAGAGVACAGATALVVRDGVFEVAVFRVAVACGESAGVVADLHQVAEAVVWLVGAGFVAVVARERRHR